MEIDVFKEEAGCKSILREFQPEFLENRVREYSSLAEALAGRDAAKIRRICHKWVGICLPYGFETLGVLARQLEEHAGAKEWQAIERGLTDVGLYLEHKKTKLKFEGRIQV